MKLKRTAAAVVAAVMAFTAVATPLGDNIPALEEAFSAGAYYSVKDNFYPVTLTGDGAVDMVNVAVDRRAEKTMMTAGIQTEKRGVPTSSLTLPELPVRQGRFRTHLRMRLAVLSEMHW